MFFVVFRLNIATNGCKWEAVDYISKHEQRFPSQMQRISGSFSAIKHSLKECALVQQYDIEYLFDLLT